MSTITRERLRERAREKVKSLEFAVTQTAFADSRAELEEELGLARIALASLEAEAVVSHIGSKNALDAIVAFIKSNRNPTLKDYNEVSERLFQDNCHGISNHVIEYIKQIGDELEELRSTQDSTPPARVYVPDFGALTKCIVQRLVDYGAADDDAIASAEEFVYNACRAAMLQGAEQPQNQQQNIPENIPVNTPCKEAPEHIWLQTAGVWPENGEFSELTWCSDNQHEDDTLYVRADVVSGNSPVIPDGWALVPVEPTEGMIAAAMCSNDVLFDKEDDTLFRVQHGEIWRSMLAAAPQQEA